LGLFRPTSGAKAIASDVCVPISRLAECVTATQQELLERLVEPAFAMDGTSTGEHGVGQGKVKYLRREHGEAALSVLRAIKTAPDPHNIMNPGKIIMLG
jgi:D-lactate dehydrogenase (cytochrome)